MSGCPSALPCLDDARHYYPWLCDVHRCAARCESRACRDECRRTVCHAGIGEWCHKAIKEQHLARLAQRELASR